VFAQQLDAFPGSLAPTLPGHGSPGEPNSIAQFADAIAQRMRDDNLRDVILVGSSMGGAVALELALRNDERVAGVALLGSSGKLRVSPAIFETIDNDFQQAARMLVEYFFSEASEHHRDAAFEQMSHVGQAQTRRDFEACNGFDVLERLSEIRVPLLALVGEKDVMVPPKFVMAPVDRIPGAQARILEGTGHLFFIERPEDTNAALRTFVSSIESLSSK
jgi:pimeloyl-ACP methyl ester carboxylesterase